MNVKGVLLDLDGVLYTGDDPIRGAAGAVQYLKKKGYIIRFVSNTTRKSRVTIEARLQALGFDTGKEEIFTPSVAAINYIKGTGKERCHLLTTLDLHSEFGEAGLVNQDNEVDWVVIGDAGNNFNYERINLAFRLILDGAGIIALEKDRYWMGSDGLMLSAGPFVCGMEYATGKTATLMGKPSREFFEMALSDMGLTPANAGMQCILVKTGKFSEEAFFGADPAPSMVISSIAEIDTIL